jgi:hypothetical protein
VHIIEKQVTVILSIDCCMRWQKINMNHPLWIPKDTCHGPAAEGCVLNFLSGGDPLWCHSILNLFNSGVKWCTHVSSQVTICCRNVVSLQFKLVQMFSRHRNTLCLLVKLQHFWNQSCTHFLEQ